MRFIPAALLTLAASAALAACDVDDDNAPGGDPYPPCGGEGEPACPDNGNGSGGDPR